MSYLWNPWHGCQRVSEGCRHCYIHKGDAKRGVDPNEFYLSKDFDKPIRKDKKNEYKMKSGLVYLCFNSDFLLDKADPYRRDILSMIKERSDCEFRFLTKRIERFCEAIPEVPNNLSVGCTVENKEAADKRLPIFKELKIKHKYIIMQPLIEYFDIEPYLDSSIELVEVGGESDKEARPLYYDWVLKIRELCIKHHINFHFRQTGSHFVKDGKEYSINYFYESKQAKEANINVVFDDK